MPSHTIASTSSGVTLTGAGYYNPVTVASGVVVSGPTIGIYVATSWTIDNLGTVAGSTSSSGILLTQGGTVVNGQSGGTIAAAYIHAGEAVYIKGNLGSVANYGTLQGKYFAVLLGQGGTISNGQGGDTSALMTGDGGVFASVSQTAPTTVVNDGTIFGTSVDGVLLQSGGQVVNGGSHTATSTALISGTSYGVYISGGTGSLTNYGTLQGGGTAYAARMDGGGTLLNGVSGANVAMITGYAGVQAASTNSLTVTNYGAIAGTGNDGVFLNDGGSIDNGQADASITGSKGGIDVFTAAGTVSNLGTIVGTALHGIYLFADGGVVTNGASAATIAPALIAGGQYGIRVGFSNSAGGTITNYGTILAYGNHPTPPTSHYSAVLVDGAGTVNNSGIIRDDAANSFDRAIRFNDGGTVSNAAGGTVAGDGTGIYIVGAAGTVNNAGSISAANVNGGDGVYLAQGGSVTNSASAASISGVATGVDISGAPGVVSNVGTITAQNISSAKGVQLRQGGSVQNGQSGSALGQIYGYDNGVYIYGPTNSGTSLGTGTVTNFGTIKGHSQVGIDLLDGGTITNGPGAYVYGGIYGVVTDFFNAPSAPNVLGTVVNLGTIVGAGFNGAGVALRSGGTVSNAANATITGAYGVSAFGSNGAGVTVVNAGTINGTGPNQLAVFFQTANDLLVDVPGAVFNGTVAAAGSATLELASAASAGTLTGLGTSFTDFDTVTVDGGAQWDVTGSNSVATGTTIAINGSADLEITGSLSGAADFQLRGGTLGIVQAIDASAVLDFTDASGTQPDKLTLGAATGASFANAITGFSGQDEIVVPNVTFVAGSTPVIGGGAMTIDLQGGGTFTFSSFAFQKASPDPIAVGAHTILDTACFVAGTMIRTDRGEVSVETLRPGDAVITLNGAMRPVRWIGQRRIDLTRHPAPRHAQPIRIRRDAIAAGVPARDLLVSPAHALFVDRCLVPAKQLLNGASIVQETTWAAVHYLHVELDSHDILFANGMPTESYLDTGNRGMFENADTPVVLHPDLSNTGERQRDAESCAPFVTDAARVEPIWYRFAERAKVLHLSVPMPLTIGDPELHILAGGRRLLPISTAAGRYIFAIPHGVDAVRLVSHATAPCDVTPWVDDHRQLGIVLHRLTLHRGDDRHEVAPDHPMLCDGWWPAERSGGRLWRWSNGNAGLTLPEGTTLVELHLAARPTQQRAA